MNSFVRLIFSNVSKHTRVNERMVKQPDVSLAIRIHEFACEHDEGNRSGVSRRQTERAVSGQNGCTSASRRLTAFI